MFNFKFNIGSSLASYLDLSPPSEISPNPCDFFSEAVKIRCHASFGEDI
jgi:hypothetical protein